MKHSSIFMVMCILLSLATQSTCIFGIQWHVTSCWIDVSSANYRANRDCVAIPIRLDVGVIGEQNFFADLLAHCDPITSVVGLGAIVIFITYTIRLFRLAWAAMRTQVSNRTRLVGVKCKLESFWKSMMVVLWSGPPLSGQFMLCRLMELSLKNWTYVVVQPRSTTAVAALTVAQARPTTAAVNGDCIRMPATMHQVHSVLPITINTHVH